MRRSLVLAPLAILLAAGSVAGQEARNSVSLQIGTLGFGAEVGRLLTDNLGVRVGGSMFRYGYDFTEDDIDYDTDLEFQSLRALGDFYPFSGRFRLTGGVLRADHSISGMGQPAEGSADFEIGDNTYSADEVGTLTLTLDYPETTPYFGIGFASRGGPGIGFAPFADLGVAVGSFDASIATTGAISDPQFQDDLETERQKVQDEISRVKVWPVLSLGFVIRF